METQSMASPTAGPYALPGSRLQVPAGSARSLRRRGTIECLSGRVWVTLPGDPADYLLRAGEKLTLPARGAVLQALDEAVICCS